MTRETIESYTRRVTCGRCGWAASDTSGTRHHLGLPPSWSSVEFCTYDGNPFTQTFFDLCPACTHEALSYVKGSRQ